MQWISKELDRRLDRKNRYLAQVEEFKAAFDGYFKAYYRDEVDYTLSRGMIFDPEGLTNATQDSRATVLRLQVFSGNKKQRHVDCSLVEAKKDGSVSFIVFREMLHGKIKPIPNDEAKRMRSRSKMWEIELAEGTEVPDRLKKIRDVRLMLNESSDFYVLTPRMKPKKEDEKDEKEN